MGGLADESAFASSLASEHVERQTDRPRYADARRRPIKSFTLRGIKDSAPYVQDRRLFTLGDTVEFLNLVRGLKLTTQEKQDLVAFMRQL